MTSLPLAEAAAEATAEDAPAAAPLGETSCARSATRIELAASAAAARDALFAAPFDRLDDDALLAHLRHRRGVRFEPVIDPEEIRPARLQGVLEGRFEFNGETHALPAPIDWLANPSADVEWHILLHKFYYAAGLAERWQATGDAAWAARWAELLDGWIGRVPPGFIAADVTGRRVQNWITSLHGLVFTPCAAAGDQYAPVPPALLRRVLHSLHEQVEYLCAHLTPKRNHRTLELLAIFIAGTVLPEFARAPAWREFALRETAANVEADLLPDGVHCELSTDYHHLALRNWLQVRTLAAENGVGVPPAMDAALQRALDFAMHVHQPSGDVPSFSDGDVRSYRAVLAQGARLFGREDLRFVASGGEEGRAPAVRLAHFPDAGYHVQRSDWHAAPAFAQARHLVFDCGPLGEGNHGHFDALSIEIAAHGRALVVDPGRYTYSEAPHGLPGEPPRNWRVHFRGTAAHNTVCVDGLPQTRYEPKAVRGASRHAAGSMRHKIAGPAPRTALVERIDGRALALLRGRCESHEYDAVHERAVVFVDGRYWIVADTLRAPTPHRYTLNFQLAAEAEGIARLTRDESAGTGLGVASPGLRLAQPQRTGQHGTLARGWVSRLYGHRHAAPAWQTHAEGRDADFDTVLWPTEDPRAVLRVQGFEAQGDDGLAAQALAIEFDGEGKIVRDRWFDARDACGTSAFAEAGVGTDPGRPGSPADGTWRLGALTFRGRWLHWRLDAAGRVARAVSHAGAQLHDARGRIDLLVAEAA